jgi:putative transcriptional regulator
MVRILLAVRLAERKWTQADLARMTGIRPTTINEMYHELVERVNLEHLELICDALDCELNELLIREEDNTEAKVNLKIGKPRSSISNKPKTAVAFCL